MTLTIYQVILGLVVLVGITVLAVLRIVNADAAIAVYSSVLGYVFGVAVPSGRGTDGGQMFKPPGSGVTVINQPTHPADEPGP